MSSRLTRPGTPGVTEKRHATASRSKPGLISKTRAIRPMAVVSAAQSRWRCLSSSVAVTVEPLRNLTGDAYQQGFVVAFTEDLVSELAQRGRGFSLQRAGSGQRSFGRTTAASEY